MCGIVGGITSKNITPLLLDGLKRLEYRGYDSSGLVILSQDNKLVRERAAGKVSNLENNLKLKKPSLKGNVGLAHTRWATHGKPSVNNAHPHISKNSISVVHNGIIENYIDLKDLQMKQGYAFTSETDTEVIAHAIESAIKPSDSLLKATQKAIKTLDGSYGIGVLSSKYPDQIIAARKGSPLVIGIGDNGNYVASDQMALLSVTDKFIFLEEGDIAEIKLDKITIYDFNDNLVERPIKTSNLKVGQVDLEDYDHFMQKEIFEQPQAIRDTLESRITNDSVVIPAFGHDAEKIFQKISKSKLLLAAQVIMQV